MDLLKLFKKDKVTTKELDNNNAVYLNNLDGNS